MTSDQRDHSRYFCSEKAVLVSEAGLANICIITNISNGGLCLSIVGSPRQPPRSRVAIKVKRGTFYCDIVKRDDHALHCKFDKPIQGDSPVTSILLSPRH
jgi:hypothetical protein